MQHIQNKLPADPSALIIGILGIVIGIAGCCCYGFTAIIPLILSIVGLVSANKSLKLYKENPSEFSASSKSNVFISKVLNIISIVINGLFLLVVIGFIAFLGVAGMKGYVDGVRDGAYPSSNDWEYEDGEEEIYDYDDIYEEEEVDSLPIDSIFIEEVYPERDTIN